MQVPKVGQVGKKKGKTLILKPEIADCETELHVAERE